MRDMFIPAAALLTIVQAAHAQSTEGQDSPIPSGPAPWTLKFEPAAWYASVNGNVKLPGSAGAGNGDDFTADELNLESPRLSPFGELQIQRNKWRFALRGVGNSSDSRGSIATADGQIGESAFAAGDTLESSFDLLTFAVDGAYAFHTYEGGRLADGGVKVRSTLLGLGGIRMIDVDIDVQITPVGSSGSAASAGGDALQAHPYAGVRWELDLYEDFTLDVVGAIGGMSFGDDESWSADILVGFQWNPTPYLGAQIGYRQLLLGVESGENPNEFAWNGGLAGVYAGATLRF